MDVLALITGSRVRADVLATMFGGPPRSWLPSDLGRASRHPRQLVRRELERLASAGLIHSTLAQGKREYATDHTGPLARELGRLIQQSRGRIPRIRHALVSLRSPTVCWATSGNSAGSRLGLSIVVLTGAPKTLVRLQLAGLLAHGTDLHCMSVREWVTRLDKGDLFLRRARRARKLWILGSWEALIARERAELEIRRTLRTVLSNWRDELSDDWDEEWDPFTVPMAPVR